MGDSRSVRLTPCSASRAGRSDGCAEPMRLTARRAWRRRGADAPAARAVRRAAGRLDSAAAKEPDSRPRRPRVHRARARGDRSGAARRCRRGPWAWVDSARLAAALWALPRLGGVAPPCLRGRRVEVPDLRRAAAARLRHPRRLIREAVPGGREQSTGAGGPSASAAARWTGSRGVDVTPRGDIARAASLAHQPG